MHFWGQSCFLRLLNQVQLNDGYLALPNQAKGPLLHAAFLDPLLLEACIIPSFVPQLNHPRNRPPEPVNSLLLLAIGLLNKLKSFKVWVHMCCLAISPAVLAPWWDEHMQGYWLLITNERKEWMKSQGNRCDAICVLFMKRSWNFVLFIFHWKSHLYTHICVCTNCLVNLPLHECECLYICACDYVTVCVCI